MTLIAQGRRAVTVPAGPDVPLHPEEVLLEDRPIVGLSPPLRRVVRLAFCIPPGRALAGERYLPLPRHLPREPSALRLRLFPISVPRPLTLRLHLLTSTRDCGPRIMLMKLPPRPLRGGSARPRPTMGHPGDEIFLTPGAYLASRSSSLLLLIFLVSV